MIKLIRKRLALTLSCQSGGKAKAAAAAGVLSCLLASPAAAQAVWAHQNGSVLSNGSVSIKSLSGGSYAGTSNPSGAVAKANQNASTQPPTVLVRGRSKAYRANGASCVYPSLSPSDTEIDVYHEVDKTKKMECWTTYPWAGTWQAEGATPPCFVGLTKSLRSTYCTIGGAVMADALGTTPIGRYVGVANVTPIGSDRTDLIAAITDLPTPKAWGCHGVGIAATVSGYADYPGGTPSGYSYAMIDGNWDGETNTYRIIKMWSDYNCSSSYYTESAALLCAAKGPKWFLPASNQLAMMAAHRVALGGFANGKYWGSDENGPNNPSGAMVFDFATNTVVPEGKLLAFNVRCARTFAP